MASQWYKKYIRTVNQFKALLVKMELMRQQIKLDALLKDVLYEKYPEIYNSIVNNIPKIERMKQRREQIYEKQPYLRTD